MKGRFVGIGVGKYAAVPELQHAVDDVRSLRALLKDYDGEPLVDPTEQEVREHLKGLTMQPQDGGSLIALWSGHAMPHASKLRLLAKDSRGKSDGILLDDFAAACAESGANQLLIIIDGCFAGTQLDEAMRIVAELKAETPEDQHWIGFLVSCSAVETARDGLFGAKLRTLVSEGPRTDDDLPRWADHIEMVDGGSLGIALLRGWDSDVQRPRFLQDGVPASMLANPRHPKNTPQRVVQRLLMAARGGDSADERSWFTGRKDEVDKVVGWVKSGVAGLRVVTGSPGTGKSAIVGRVVSLANGIEREHLIESGTEIRHADPGLGSVHAHVHAQTMDANRLADLISKQLVAQGRVQSPTGPRRDAAELVGAIQKTEGLVIVVDGLDEARGESFTIATTLLTKLAPHCTVIVATREVQRAAGGAPLLTELAPIETLDLDDYDSTDDVHDYVLARLGDEKAAAQLATEPFYTAWLITNQPRDGLDPRLSLTAALEKELNRVPAARPLLSALTLSFGSGFPEPEWIAAASALCGEPLTSDDVAQVLAELGSHVVQDREEGAEVYKLAHQSFADHLRPPFAPSREQVFAPESAIVAAALIDRYTKLIENGIAADAAGYLWKYAWRHCGHAGPDGLVGLRKLAGENPKLVPDIALAATTTANELTHWGRPVEAVSPLEEAADNFRDLVPVARMYLGDLAYVLNRLGQRYRDAGKVQQAIAPAEEAVIRYRELVAKTPTTAETVTHKRLAQRVGRSHSSENVTYVPHLSVSLVDLSDLYAQAGRREALDTAEAAVALMRPHGDEPVHRPPLAKALRCLAARCHEMGRYDDAMRHSREAVALYQRLAESNPAFLSDEASALLSLGRDYVALRRQADAEATAEKAAQLGQRLEEDGAYRPNLAEALLSVSALYAVIGRCDDARAAAERAARLAEGLPTHGAAVLNLAKRYRDANRAEEAMATAQHAIETFLATDGRQQDLVAALSTLDTVCATLGRPDVVDETWHRVIARSAKPDAATLLMLRAASATPGDREAVGWLRSALVLAGTSRLLIGDLHDLARRHFDAAENWPWPNLPGWLTVDRALLRIARDWVHTPTYLTERDHLTQHPELLEATADVAIAEALLGVSINEAQNLQQRRITAQEEGITEAYRRVLLTSVADEFLDATSERRRELLGERRDDLLTAEAMEVVHGNRSAHALLTIAKNSPDVLDQTFEALDHPVRIPELLYDLAVANAGALRDVTLALGTHPDVPLYRAVERMLTGDQAAARTFVRGCRQPLLWIIELTRLVPVHPELLTLIRIVAEEASS